MRQSLGPYNYLGFIFFLFLALKWFVLFYAEMDANLYIYIYLPVSSSAVPSPRTLIVRVRRESR